jgi:multidrug resistance efflux pump
MATATEPTVDSIPTRAAPAAADRRRIVLPILALVLVLGLVYGFRSWRYARAHESTDNA